MEPFARYRALTDESYQRFFDQGAQAADERRQIADQLETILAATESDFPLDAAGVQALREEIAGHVLAIHDIEAAAVAELKEAMT